MLDMIEIGYKRERIVRVAKLVNGKRKLVPKLGLDGKPETVRVACEPVRVTRRALEGRFCRDAGRRLVVKLRDGDILELRPQGTRQAATAALSDIYAWMLRSRADAAKMAQLRERKAKLADQRIERRLRRSIHAQL